MVAPTRHAFKRYLEQAINDIYRCHESINNAHNLIIEPQHQKYANWLRDFDQGLFEAMETLKAFNDGI